MVVKTSLPNCAMTHLAPVSSLGEGQVDRAWRPEPMAKSAMKRQPAKTPAAIDLDAGLAGITATNVEQLRSSRLPFAPHHRSDRWHSAPADLNVTGLAKALTSSSADPERAILRAA